MDYLIGMGFTPLMIFSIALIMLWDMIWKLIGMWKAARKGSAVWFVALMIFNTFGILPILYVYVFSEMKKHRTFRKVRRKRR